MMVAGVGALSAHYCQAQAASASMHLSCTYRLCVYHGCGRRVLQHGEGVDAWVVIGGCIILLSNFQAMMSEQ